MALFAKVLFLGMGLYMLLGAILNWSSLVNGRKEQRLAEAIGEKGVRIFYAFMGTLLIIIGIMLFFIDTSIFFKS